MIDVICVLWGDKFSVDYVYKLKSAVARNTTIPHRFQCLSDRKIPGVDTFALPTGYEGWWNKLALFYPYVGMGNRAVYFDLDTLITGNIDWLLNYNGDFMGIEDLGSVNAHQPYLKGRMQSGVMAWDRTKYEGIWVEALFNYQSIAQQYRGDGEFLNDHIKRRDLLQNLYPGRLKSYKYQVYPNRPDDKTSIVCFHGRPSVKQATEIAVNTPMNTYYPQKWILEYWKDD